MGHLLESGEAARQTRQRLEGHPDKLVELVERIASASEVLVDEILGRSRDRRACEVRQEVWRRMSVAGYTLLEIGRLWERDHTTILHGVRLARGRRQHEIESPSTYARTVGQTVRAMRNRRGQSLAVMATAVDVSIGVWTKLEAGETAMTVAQLRKIARALGVEPWEVLRRADERFAERCALDHQPSTINLQPENEKENERCAPRTDTVGPLEP